MNPLVAKVTGLVQENTQEEWEVDAPFYDRALEQIHRGFLEHLQTLGITGPDADARWNQAKPQFERTMRTFSADKLPEWGNRLGVWRKPDDQRASYKWMKGEA